jgi:hypothetical protein
MGKQLGLAMIKRYGTMGQVNRARTRCMEAPQRCTGHPRPSTIQRSAYRRASDRGIP